MRRTNKIDVDFQAVTRLAANGLTQRETAKEIYLCYNTFKDRPEIRAAWRKGHEIYIASLDADAASKAPDAVSRYNFRNAAYQEKAPTETKSKQFKTLSEINKEAREVGITYGQFVAGGKKSYYKTCPHCGATLDPGEICECVRSSFSQLTDENKIKINALISRKLEEQEREEHKTAGGTQQ